MFCGKCGAQVDGGRFCPKCGAPLPQPGTGPMNQQPGYGAAQGPAQSAGAGPAGQGYPGYAGQQPNYGTPQGPAGQSSPNYGYAGTQTAYAAQNKKSKLPIIIAVAVVAVVVIAVYFLFIRDPLVGTWSYEQDGATMSFTFKSNGTGVMEVKYGGIEVLSEKFTWKTLSGGRLSLTDSYGDEEIVEYSISGNKLRIIEDYETITLTKK